MLDYAAFDSTKLFFRIVTYRSRLLVVAASTIVRPIVFVFVRVNGYYINTVFYSVTNHNRWQTVWCQLIGLLSDVIGRVKG